ncbi:hypothetical protein HY388_00110 [Candidatus Daviesbacteria bacterium]|nr:hypothetical protein [Candidatus Daviesbacteria bacterium]
MSADLEQNVINTIYAIFIHNYLVIAYVSGALLSAILSLTKPTRYHLFLFFGFCLLVFAFEYNKHIAEPFYNQTLQSLITVKEHFRVRKLLDLLIYELIPVASFVFGWGFIFIALVLGGKVNQRSGKPE